MNTKNNKRRRESVRKIESALVQLLQDRELRDITVADICKQTGLNRSTFYANFEDIFDLADRLRETLEQDFAKQFTDAGRRTALTMFEHIKENQLFYKTYFKLGYEDRHQTLVYDHLRAMQDFGGKNIGYHIEFFRSGLNAVIKMWLAGGCAESPEEMAQVLQLEYRGRQNEQED